MKRCPTCDKTFDDGMRFCQTDGTVLVADAPVDPYKTIVSNQIEIPAPPLDPFKTMVATPPKFVEEDVLQLSEEPDAMKTMIASQDDMKEASKPNEAEDVLPLDLPPPSPFGGYAPIVEPPVETPNDFSSAPPNFSDSGQAPNLPKPMEASPSDATAVMDSNSFQESAPPESDARPLPNDFSQHSPYGNQENKPIPSPFDLSIGPGYQPPSASPFDEPKPAINESPNQSPFGQPMPYAQAEPFNQPMQQAEWTPPPAPVSEWQNQNLGANTPFQAPGAATGQDQTLAVVSLVCGIASILCCGFLTGIPAIITGFMAKNNVDANPNQYGGRGMAIAGMILGSVSIVLTIIVVALQILFGVLGNM